MSDDLLYHSAEQHLDLFLANKGNSNIHYVVFHRTDKPALPRNSYAVVKVEIVSFDEVLQPIEKVMERELVTV